MSVDWKGVGGEAREGRDRGTRRQGEFKRHRDGGGGGGEAE
jgi:hypothetical protein